MIAIEWLSINGTKKYKDESISAYATNRVCKNNVYNYEYAHIQTAAICSVSYYSSTALPPKISLNKMVLGSSRVQNQESRQYETNSAVKFKNA